ncbi:MAG: SPOR domain-containing protein [Methylococcales bacterium]|nr:SPOR domain-containing protein [Methylococcales bacterium]
MEQELKQRLIGAAVITALAAIFVPMLFDDPVDDTEKKISALKLPEVPVKVQDVEITPLPDKVEEVVAEMPASNPPKPAAEPGLQNLDEPAMEAPAPSQRLSARETEQPAARRLKEPKAIIPEDEDVAEAENAAPAVKPHVKPTLPATPPAPPRVAKPAARTPDNTAANPLKPAEPAPAISETGTRLYLNVGSFSHKNNAFALEEKLKQQGFPATVKEITGDKGPVFKVRVGPMPDKAKVQAVKNRLTQININSFVTPDE